MKKISLPNKNKYVFVVLLGISFVIGWYGFNCAFEKVCEVSTFDRAIRSHGSMVMPNGKVITLEVADTISSRELGLSGRTSMRDDEGMLFVFDKQGKYGFWMKDMLFSLDIIWINKDGVIVHVEHDATPESYFNFNPPKTFINTPDAKYVLEVPAGAAEKYGIYLGTRVKIGE